MLREILFFTLLTATLALNWQCKFEEDSECECYQCEVLDKPTESFEKKHRYEKTNNDVIQVLLKSKRTIHGDLFQQLPNVEIVLMKFSNFEKLSEGQFNPKGMNVREFHGNLNEIVEVGPGAFDFAPNVEKIEMRHNQIKKLDKDAFKGLQKLNFLHLGSNFIDTLDVETFSDLVNLETINLGNNKLTTLPANIFKNNQKLKLLTLSDNKFHLIEKQALLQLPERCMVFLKRAQCFDKTFTVPENFDETHEIIASVKEKCSRN